MSEPTTIPRATRRARQALAPRVGAEAIAELARSAELPANVTDIAMGVRVEPGGELPNGTPDGRGGRTVFGPVWVIEGRTKSPLIAELESQADAHALYDALAGEEGELWQRKQRRLAAIAAAEAAEAEELAISRENAKTVARANEGGAGSPRRSRSSETPTASSGRGTSRRELSRRA